MTFGEPEAADGASTPPIMGDFREVSQLGLALVKGAYKEYCLYADKRKRLAFCAGNESARRS